MKKYIIFGVTCFCLVFLLIYLYWPKKEVDQILIVKEAHYMLYEPDIKLTIRFFQTNSTYQLDAHFTSGFIQNASESIKFIVDDIKINKIHDEMYLDKRYYGYKMELKLPDITGSYEFEELILKLKLDDLYYTFEAGSLYVEYPEANDKFFNWRALEGIKKETPQLSQILIDFIDSAPIEKVMIGKHELDYFIMDNQLVIQMMSQSYLFSKTYIKVYTSDGITYLPNFEYFMNYELLENGVFKPYNLK
jgi:hypothetical protein